jgi:hypothetical protein
MPYVYVPDPQPPQSGPQYYPQQQPVVFVPTPPISPISKPPKPGKGLSYKRMKKISDDWVKMLSDIDEAKKKGKPDAKKKEGLNWMELSLLLIFVSMPIACIEVGAAFGIVHLIFK